MAILQEILQAIVGTNTIARGFLVRHTEATGTYGVYMLNSNMPKTVIEVNTDTLVYAMSQNFIKLYNLELQGGKLVGTNGSLSRYAQTINGGYVDSNLVILAELVDERGVGVGYKCCTPLGLVYDLSKKDVIEKCKILTETFGKCVKAYTPISNGKLLEKDGKLIVSSIKGAFNKITVSTNKNKKESKVAGQSNNNTSNNSNFDKQSAIDFFKAIKLCRQESPNKHEKRLKAELDKLNKNLNTVSRAERSKLYKRMDSLKADLTRAKIDSDDIYLWLKEDETTLSVCLDILKDVKTIEDKASKIITRGTEFTLFIEIDGKRYRQSFTEQYRNWRKNRSAKYQVPSLKYHY